MQQLQRRARVDAELVGEPVAGAAVHVERLGGPALPVQREHVQLDEAFTDGLLARQAREFGQQFVVAAQFQAGGEPLLDRVRA